MEIFSYLLIESFALGVQENHLIESVLLSTHTDTCFGLKIRSLLLIIYPCLMAWYLKTKKKEQFFLFLKQAKHILWELKRTKTETVLLSPSTYVKTDKLENFRFYAQNVCVSRPLNKRLDSSVGNMFSSN